MTFAEKIQMLRKEKGWSQEELATRVPISRQAVSKWENGTSMPDTENVLALADLFGVTTDYLLREDCISGDDTPETHHREDTARLEQNRRVAWIVCVGFQYLGLFWIVFGTLIDSSVLLPLLGVTIHISAIAGFEFGLHWHCALPDTAAIAGNFTAFQSGPLPGSPVRCWPAFCCAPLAGICHSCAEAFSISSSVRLSPAVSARRITETPAVHPDQKQTPHTFAPLCGTPAQSKTTWSSGRAVSDHRESPHSGYLPFFEFVRWRSPAAAFAAMMYGTVGLARKPAPRQRPHPKRAEVPPAAAFLMAPSCGQKIFGG